MLNTVLQAICQLTDKQKEESSTLMSQSGVALTQRVVDAVGLLLHLLVQSLHVLHQQGHHLTLQLGASTGHRFSGFNS